MATADSNSKLRFSELEAHFDVGFWYELERLKLNEWRLETPAVTVAATIPTAASIAATKAHHLAARATFDGESFGGAARSGADAIECELVNHNTEEELKAMDKAAALARAARPVVAAIAAGDLSATPVVRGVVRTFADLKKHVFTVVTAFPVLDCPAKATYSLAGTRPVEAALFSVASAKVSASIPMLVGADGALLPLTAANVVAAVQQPGHTLTLAMQDYAAAQSEYPSWGWRNVLAAVRAWAPAVAHIDLVCIRDTAESSRVFSVTCSPDEAAAAADQIRHAAAAAAADAAEEKPALRLVGWASKLHRVDLGAMMDPTRLAESSARLNLGLMKWRMMPDLDLSKIASTKALLLGSGTLGCNIARHLMMWGVNHITLVDRGTVSYSNPVRQTLFELSDCTAEGEDRVKSVAAARAIKRILPTCNATGVCLTIRMPGHAIDAAHEAEARADVERLEELIKAHDVVFLLTDSRESRWLPTLLCSAHNKPVINSALGFDTYVVMRHGLSSVPVEKRVGCYFCNDVVAPMDSLTARTLDQQCTVTRPGVSAMASALSVEVLAALCNHPEGFACPAYIPSEEEDGAQSTARTVIGVVPHQIRGSVSDYTSMVMHGQAYDKCTACSDKVVGLYREQGFGFVLQCLNNPKHMEEVTGLAAERAALEADYGNWDEDDFDD